MPGDRIIICGYPRSGTTWLTRLTAEIVGCPAAGFWCEPFNPEESIEGLSRPSTHLCFKAHHNREEMDHTLSIYGNGSERIIYIVRDPRDVIVSASHYVWASNPHGPRTMRGLWRRLERSFLRGLPGLAARARLARFAEKILNGGGRRDSRWLRTPWKDHVQGFISSDVLVVRYEDLVESPLGQARRICQYLGLDRSERQLAHAIDLQSFEKKKRQLLEARRRREARNLRQGTTGQWPTRLDHATVERVNQRLSGLLTTLEYRKVSFLEVEQARDASTPSMRSQLILTALYTDEPGSTWRDCAWGPAPQGCPGLVMDRQNLPHPAPC